MSNVLLILADDMRQDLLPFMPFVSGTLRASGTEFTHAYCEVPICQAARAGLLTGQHAHSASNGVYQNADTLPSYTNLLPTWLTGVSRGMFGKVPLGYAQQAARPGWDTWRVFASVNEQEAYGYSVYDGSATTSPTSHQLSYIVPHVQTFITTAAQPFFAWWSPTNPHVNTSTFTNNPLPTTMDKFEWLQWPFSLLTSTTGKPTWISGLAAPAAAALSAIRLAARQQVREVYDLDVQIATLYAALGGRAADTYIIFVSDSGVFFGEQRLGSSNAAEKDHPYDVAAKVPCIIAGPGIPAGGTNTTPITLQDITATITAILGGTPTITQTGTDIRTFITTPNPGRPILYERHGNVSNGYPDGVGVITATRKLIRWTEGTGTPATNFTTNPNDHYEMYDLDTDPHELTNVANVGGRLTERTALDAQITALL